MKLYKIRKSKIDNKGRGLYATKNIKEGTKIINYLGKIITNKEVEESDKYDNKKHIYLFTLNKKYTLDGDLSFNIASCPSLSFEESLITDDRDLVFNYIWKQHEFNI